MTIRAVNVKPAQKVLIMMDVTGKEYTYALIHNNLASDIVYGEGIFTNNENLFQTVRFTFQIHTVFSLEQDLCWLLMG